MCVVFFFLFTILSILIPFTIFSAHLSHRLKVSYFHQPIFVDHCASSIVCSQQFALNSIFSETTTSRALIFGKKHCLVNLYQNCSKGNPGNPKWSSCGGGGVRKKKHTYNLLLQTCKAYMIKIWYITLASGTLPICFHMIFVLCTLFDDGLYLNRNL